MRQQNLLLDLKDPLKKKTFTDDDPIGDADTGTWQELTEKNLCTVPRVLLCALILFIDAITVPVQFIIGDTEGHDKLCCKQAGHGTDNARL